MKTSSLRLWALLAALSLLLASAALAAPAPQNLAFCTAAAPAAMAPAAATAPAPLWLAAAQQAKCATCSELQRACKDFCGANNINFQCQGNNPCAGTCSCIVPPA
jgi:hypothetical protein